MRALLIQAGMPPVRRPYDVVEKGQIMMPLGLGYLAAILRGKGVEVKLKDYLAEEFNNANVTALINNFQPDFVGISTFTATYNQGLKIARMVKSVKSLPVVMGGLHVTFLPEEALKDNAIDFVIRGEGEETLSELIDCLEGRRTISAIRGLSFKDNGKIVHNPARQEIEDLEILPYPDWAIFDKRLYASPFTGEINAPIIFGRGCPYGCSFCSVGRKKRRERKAGSVVDEFKRMKERFGYVNFIVTDDIHLKDGEFRKIMELLAAENLGIKWKMTNRLDNIDRSLLPLMKKAGCQAIGYGLESPQRSTLGRINKNITLSSHLEAMQWTREAGINAAASFMFGFPWETKEDIKETIRFSAALPLYSICYNLIAYFPGTGMFDQLLKEGKVGLKDFNWDDFTLHRATFPTASLSREELDDYLEKAYDYFSKNQRRFKKICKKSGRNMAKEGIQLSGHAKPFSGNGKGRFFLL